MIWLIGWAGTVGLIMWLLPKEVQWPLVLAVGYPPRWVTPLEALPALLAAATGPLLAPGLASWERSAATRRPHGTAACTATAALTALAVVPFITAAVLPFPDHVPLLDYVGNVAQIAAVSLVVTALVGPFAGAAAAIGCYLALIIAQHLLADLMAHVPFSDLLTHSRTSGAFTAGAIAAACALTVWTATAGTGRR